MTRGSHRNWGWEIAFHSGTFLKAEHVAVGPADVSRLESAQD